MNPLPPIPPQDPGFQLSGPMDMNNGSPAPKFRLKKFLFFLRRFWWIPLITLVLALGAAVANFRSLPPQFISLASVWETEKLELPGDSATFSENPDNYFGNLTQVLQSDTLRQQALARLLLAGKNSIPTDKSGNPLGVQINVFQEPKSSVFTVQAISANPAYTQTYLNALINSYLEFKKNIRKQVSGDTLASVSTLIERYGQDMKSDQATLANYEQSNNLVLLRQESSVAAGYLAKLKTQLADYELQSNMLDAVALEKSETLTTGTNLVNPLFEQIQGTGSSASPVSQSQDQLQQIESLKLERARLSKYLRPEHPKIVKLDEQITNAQNLVAFYRTQNQRDILTARQAMEIRINSVQRSIDHWETRLNYDNSRIVQADNLTENIARNQGLYDKLVSMMDNVDISRNIDQDTLAPLQPASEATRSYAKLKSNLSTASFGGLAIGLGIVLLLAIRDDRFASVVEVAERIGDHVVGQVPEIPQPRRGSPLALLGNNDDRHMYVESYRNLRSALLYLAVNGTRPKVLLITSAVPDEGKSTIASNLSSAMAMGGARVLLIDGDMRKGHLHEAFGLKSKPGLSDLLLRPENEDSFIQTTSMPNLSFIARGTILRNPGDLFLSNTFDGLLAKFRERFDYIIIDSSPVFAADDSTTLAPKMDGTLFVVRSRFSRSNVVKEALELLYQRQATVLGLILNRTDASGRSYHYYNYSEYHHNSTETT